MRLSVVMTELQHAQVQLRLMASLLALTMVFGLLDPAFLLASRTESIIFRASTATSLGPDGLAVAFSLLAAGLVPFLAMQCGCWPAARRGVGKATCLVLVLAALLWFFLTWRVAHLDFGDAVAVLFARNGAAALVFALALALSLNAEQLRSLLEPFP